MASEFDSKRAILYESPQPSPFTVTRYIPLSQALTNQILQSQDHMLVASIQDHVIVLPTLEMIYYHVAQGQWHGVDWMASFCVLCNAGSLFDARLNDVTYHFAAQGFYDAMSLIADQETQSYWNHITGVCLYGPLAGKELSRLSPLLQMAASDAVTSFPGAQVAVMSITEDDMTDAYEMDERLRRPDTPVFSPRLQATLGQLDTRLPRYDMGLGVWTPTTQRYYPISTLYQKHNAVIDQVDGRTVVVVVDSVVGLPIAFYAEATDLEFHGDYLILGPEMTYHRGALYHKGQLLTLERPNQNAIRWFAFSSLFPNCQIYGQTGA